MHFLVALRNDISLPYIDAFYDQCSVSKKYFFSAFNIIFFYSFCRILGLTNNFAYVVMLSAAFDILGGQLGHEKVRKLLLYWYR